MDVPSIDWSIFDQYPKNEIECECGAIYHSHSKCTSVGGMFTIVTRTACPSCNKQFGHVRAARSDWISESIGPEDVLKIK